MNCDTCKHWLLDFGTTGECRRHPPRVIVCEEGAESYFPRTVDTEFCGEYQRSAKYANVDD